MKYVILMCLAFCACNDRTQMVSRPLKTYTDTVIYSVISDTVSLRTSRPAPRVDSTLYYLRKISKQLEDLSKQAQQVDRKMQRDDSCGIISVSEPDTAFRRKRYNPTRIINKAHQQVSRFSDSLIRQLTFEQNLRYN